MTKIQPNHNTETFTNPVSETGFINPRDKKPGFWVNFCHSSKK